MVRVLFLGLSVLFVSYFGYPQKKQPSSVKEEKNTSVTDSNKVKEVSSSRRRSSRGGGALGEVVKMKNKELKILNDSISSILIEQEEKMTNLSVKKDSLITQKENIDLKKEDLERELEGILKEISALKGAINKMKFNKYEPSTISIQELERFVKVAEAKINSNKGNSDDKERLTKAKLNLSKQKRSFSKISEEFEGEIKKLDTVEAYCCFKENTYLCMPFEEQKEEIDSIVSKIKISVDSLKTLVSKVKSSQLEMVADIRTKYITIEKARKIIVFKSGETYLKYGEEINLKYTELKEMLEKEKEKAKAYMIPRDKFEKLEDYEERIAKGKSMSEEIEEMFKKSIEDLKKKYLDLEYKNIIIPMIIDSYKKEEIKDIKVYGYNVDTEEFRVDFRCCAKDTLYKYKVKATPVEAKYFFEKPKGVVLYVDSQLKEDGVELFYFNKRLVHEELSEKVYPLGEQRKPLYGAEYKKEGNEE